jgi:hypothetical protein
MNGDHGESDGGHSESDDDHAESDGIGTKSCGVRTEPIALTSKRTAFGPCEVITCDVFPSFTAFSQMFWAFLRLVSELQKLKSDQNAFETSLHKKKFDFLLIRSVQSTINMGRHVVGLLQTEIHLDV